MSILTKSIDIADMRVKNRFVMASMATGFATKSYEDCNLCFKQLRSGNPIACSVNLDL